MEETKAAAEQTARVWTRQHPAALRALEETGVYRANAAAVRKKNGAIADYYLDLYDWYIRRAERRVPRPLGTEYPIWLFLDRESRLPPVENGVTLELEIPRRLIVVTDTERWGWRVNYLYVPRDAADLERHRRELERNGIVNETALIQTGKGNFYPLLRREITASWERMFEPPVSAAQGTVWELRREWLRGAECLV